MLIVLRSFWASSRAIAISTSSPISSWAERLLAKES
jgi:hypothetical protein